MEVNVGYLLTNLLWLAAYVVAAVALFMRKREMLPVISFAMMALLSVYEFLAYRGNYMIYDYYRGIRFGVFSLFCMLPALVNMAGYVIAAFLAVAQTTEALPNYKERTQKLWFLPAACIAGAFLVALIVYVLGLLAGSDWIGYRAYLSFAAFFYRLLAAGAMLAACLWLAYPEGTPQFKAASADAAAAFTGGYAPAPAVSAAPAGNSAAAPRQPGDAAYCGLGKHVLLLLFTFGIWYLIWIYRVTGYLNRVEDEPPRNPTTKLLLCMFVPFYSIYWVYKSAQRVDKLAAAGGLASDITTLCLILAIFVPIIPPILMQDKINAIVTAGADGGTQYAAPQQPQYAPPQRPAVSQQRPAGAGLGAAEELKAYKELLDMGAITPEEFDAKKKQLLGL